MKGRIGIMVALAVLGISCQQKTEMPDQEPIPVKIYVVRPDSLSQYLRLTGGLEAAREALLYSKVTGKLVTLKVAVGQTVAAGRLLGVQENEVLFQQMKQAESAVRMAEVQYRLAQKEFERMSRLYEEQAIASQQFDQARSQLEQLEAQLKQALAAWNLARQQYDHTFFRAPFPATVAAVYFDEGDMVPAGQPVFRLVTPGAMIAPLHVPERYFRHIDVGQRVLAHFPALPGKSFRGRIFRKDAAVDPLSRTFEVRVTLENRSAALASGLYGEFLIELRREVDTIVVPRNALLSRTEVVINPQTGTSEYRKRFYVFLVKQGTAYSRRVEPGIESSDRVQIRQGLAPGDSLIVVGQKLVKEGSPVRVVREEMQGDETG